VLIIAFYKGPGEAESKFLGESSLQPEAILRAPAPAILELLKLRKLSGEKTATWGTSYLQ
jgi:hypothetical protein